MSAHGSDGTPRRAPDGPYRSEVHPPPDRERPPRRKRPPERKKASPPDRPDLARDAFRAGLSIFIAGPVVGLGILVIADFTEGAWRAGLSAGPVLGAAAFLFSLNARAACQSPESRTKALTGAILAVAGGAASWIITAVVGIVLVFVIHPLGGYHR